MHFISLSAAGAGYSLQVGKVGGGGGGARRSNQPGQLLIQLAVAAAALVSLWHGVAETG